MSCEHLDPHSWDYIPRNKFPRDYKSHWVCKTCKIPLKSAFIGTGWTQAVLLFNPCCKQHNDWGPLDIEVNLDKNEFCFKFDDQGIELTNLRFCPWCGERLRLIPNPHIDSNL